MILVLLSCSKNYTDEDIDNLFGPISSKYEIKMVYKVDDDFLSPIETMVPFAGPAKGTIIKPIDLRVLVRYPHLLKIAFEK
jgi:hypothetical protein